MSLQQVFKPGTRRWVVDYELCYDGGGSEFRSAYRTYLGARIGIFYNKYIGSWGGTAKLQDLRRT